MSEFITFYRRKPFGQVHTLTIEGYASKKELKQSMKAIGLRPALILSDKEFNYTRELNGTISIKEDTEMKFKKVEKVPFFPDYVREDGKVTIRPNAARQEFDVYDEKDNKIDTVKLLRDAKAKYAEPTGTTVTFKENTIVTKVVTMKAFTGMLIGEFTATHEKEGWRVITKKGTPLWFNEDGTQVGGNRYANRIEF